MNPDKRARRLLKLATTIEKNHKAFDMDYWMMSPTYGAISSIDSMAAAGAGEGADPIAFLKGMEVGKPVSCGTKACAAGWAMLLWPEEAAELAVKKDNHTIADIAGMLLGYEEGAHVSLFTPGEGNRHVEDVATNLRDTAVRIIQGNE